MTSVVSILARVSEAEDSDIESSEQIELEGDLHSSSDIESLSSEEIEVESGFLSSSDQMKILTDYLLQLIRPGLQVPYLTESRLKDISFLIETHVKAEDRIFSESQLVSFLGQFFTENVLEQVQWNFNVIQESALGIEYSYRGTLGSYAVRLLGDLWISIEENGMMLVKKPSDASGSHEGDFAESKDQVYFSGGGSREGLGGPGRGLGGFGRGSGGFGRGSGGSGEGPSGSGGGSGSGGHGGTGRGSILLPNPVNKFSSIPPFLLRVPDFDSPEKKHLNKIDFNTKLKKASGDFQSHPRLRKYKMSKCYNPAESSDKDVVLFHGTRSLNLERFQQLGILPTNSNTEFSLAAAFYTSNSVRHAYEHVFHTHPGNSWRRAGTLYHPNPVMVFVFSVDSSVLHGSKPPVNGESSFLVRWFPARSLDEKLEWQEFCSKNLRGVVGDIRRYDIVIGPICLPWKSEVDNGMTMAYVEGRRCEQVAFTSMRAIMWLQDCLTEILQEQRDQNFQQVGQNNQRP